MKSFISAVKQKRAIRLWSVLTWIIVWQIISILVEHDVLLVSPVTVFLKLLQLVREPGFWQSVSYSFIRIAAAFFLATLSWVIFAALSARFRRIEEFLAPFMLIVKATPVASFIILVLIWIPARNLSMIISYLMVLPIIYTNVLSGIRSTDIKLLEMAVVFEIPKRRRITHIYVSQVLPFFQSACLLGLGLCWKSGIAAEVIGIPKGSIGERLYTAKIFLATPDLFAWTLTIILISVIFEKVFMLLVQHLIKRLERL